MRADGDLRDAVDAIRFRQDQLAETVEEMRRERAAVVVEVEHTIGRVAAMLREADARAQQEAEEMREGLLALSRRLDRVDARPSPPRLAGPVHPPLTSLTTLISAAFDGLVERVEQGRTHTAESLHAMERALGDIERRVRGAEAAPPAPDELLPEIPEVTAPLSTTELRAPDEMDAAVRELSGQVAAAEQRSTEALGRMGHEVIRVATRMDARLGDVERASVEHAARLAGELARLATEVDGKLARADESQARLLEALGGRIAGVADRLSERIAAAERQNALVVREGLDAVGERLRDAHDRLDAQHQRAATELAELARESEARAAETAGPAPEPGPEPSPDRIALPEPPTVRRRASATHLHAEPPPNHFDKAPDPPAGAPIAGREEATLILTGGVPPTDRPAAVDATPERAGSHRELIETARLAARQNAETTRRPAWGRRSVPPGEGPDGAEPHILRGGLELLRRTRR